MTEVIDKKVLNILEDAVEVANLIGVESMVIDEHSVRGRHTEAGAIFLMPFPADTKWNFGSIGVTRVQELGKRLAVIRGRSDAYTAETTLKTRGDVTYAHTITFKHNKSKVEYRCGDPTLIKAPRGIADEHMFSIVIGRSDIGFIKAAANAMKAPHLVFSNAADTDEVTISIPTKDKAEAASNVMDQNVLYLGNDKSFTFKYDTDILLKAIISVEKILRKDGLDEIDVVITRRGGFHIIVNGMTVYIVPSP